VWIQQVSDVKGSFPKVLAGFLSRSRGTHIASLQNQFDAVFFVGSGLACSFMTIPFAPDAECFLSSLRFGK
jgi:hypothetical protein